MELPLLAGRAERMRSRLKIRFVSSRIRVAMAPKHSFVPSHWQATPSSSQSLRGPFLDHFEDHPNLAQITTGRGFFGHSKHSLMTRGESAVTPSVNMRQSLPPPWLSCGTPCHTVSWWWWEPHFGWRNGLVCGSGVHTWAQLRRPTRSRFTMTSTTRRRRRKHRIYRSICACMRDCTWGVRG